jgi:hypothetical protein
MAGEWQRELQAKRRSIESTRLVRDERGKTEDEFEDEFDGRGYTRRERDMPRSGQKCSNAMTMALLY